MTDYSVVEYFAEHEGYKCGYCKSPNTNYSHGMWAHQLSVIDYQDLIDRGWRRSGKYCYKPTMEVTCCPMYTIKCAIRDFKLSKSQKKVLKRMNKFLIYGKNEDMKEHEQSTNYENTDTLNEFPDISLMQKSSKIDKDDLVKFKRSNVFSDKNTFEEGKASQSVGFESATDKMGENDVLFDTKEVKNSHKPNLGIDPSKPLCRKAKDIRRERRLQKLASKSKDDEIMEEVFKPNKREPKVKTLEEFLSEAEVENAVHKLEIKVVRSEPPSGDFKNTFPESLTIYQTYQMNIHGDKLEKCSEKQFTRFLVNSPLKEEPSLKLPFGFGSFHQQYWLDDKLIAVGVIDILPNCISSVYLFYDPEYSFLSLGTYAALREIAFTRELNKLLPELNSYYMGFYIHTCPKMRYKGQYYPSFLLCPETYTWHSYESCKLKLDVAKYSRLTNDTKRVDENGEVMLSEMLVLYRRKIRTYPAYCAITDGKDIEEVQQYASLVGRKCYSRMLLYRS